MNLLQPYRQAAQIPKMPPTVNDEEDDEDEAPETPTDEPEPVPIQDPPSEDAPAPPMTVA